MAEAKTTINEKASIRNSNEQIGCVKRSKSFANVVTELSATEDTEASKIA